ncbi:MAG: hypothetical protein RIK87_21475 [Fuerstiella sp.]
MPIKVRCRCGKGLKVRDSAAGKRIRCPECGKPVAVPEPEWEDVPFEEDAYAEDSYGSDSYGDDPYGDDPYGQDDGGASAPRRRRPSKKGTKKKSKKASSSGAMLPLMIVGGVSVAVLVVAGVLYAVLGGNSGGPDVASSSPPVNSEPAGATTAETTPATTPTSSTPTSSTPTGSTPAASPGNNMSGSHDAAGPGTAPPAAASLAGGGTSDGLWVVLSDFKQLANPQSIGKTYQVNYRIAAGRPDPSREYVIYLGASMGVLERYTEIPVDLQSNGSVTIPVGLGASGAVKAYVAWKKGRQEWQPVSGEITVGAGPTTAQRPPTVQEAAGAAAQGKLLALANARFEQGRIGRNALVVDYVLQRPYEAGKRYIMVISGDGTPVQTDITLQLGRATQGETDQLGVSLLPGSEFPAGNLKVHIERRMSMMIRGESEIVSNTAIVRR